jgi:hypothetical protein
MRQYTLHELNRLAQKRLLGFNQNESPDDIYTTQYSEFKHNIELFLSWIKEMESKNKIDELLK